MRIRGLAAGAILLLCLTTAAVAAAELQEEAARAYAVYAGRATQAFVSRARAAAPAAQFPEVRRDGDLAARPAGEDGILEVPGGLVHHWAGAAFIGGVTLQRALDVSMAYADYHRVYEPIVESRLLGREGDTFRVLFRIREGVSGVSVILDVRSSVRYVYPRGGRAYVVSSAEEIRQVTDAGGGNEARLPPGQDSGYLWRAHALTSLIERDGGVYVEMETVGLSRGFPPMLGWIIEPIARRLGRKSVEASLREFGDAVRAARGGD